MIEVAQRMADVKRLVTFLDSFVRPSLRPDVSNYAKGRLRVWLRVEPSLTNPTTLRDGLAVNDAVWKRLQEIAQMDFDYCLATYSGDEKAIGITPHRDASYADYEAYALNVSGECKFDYWMGREGFGKGPSTKEHDPKKDPPTHSMILQPGQLVHFNCKNLHAATPSVKRWNLNFWSAK